MPDRSASANQPKKVNPALVVVKDVGNDSAVLVVTAVTTEPESVSNVTVRSLALHLA